MSTQGGGLSREHGVGCDEEEGGIRDWVDCPLGLILVIRKRIGLLWCSFHVQMVALHFIF